MVIFCDNAVVTSSEEQDRIAETPTIGEILRNEFIFPSINPNISWRRTFMFQ